MKQERNYINPTSLDISIEDFDAMDGVHVFSTEYQRQKKKMLKKYRKHMLRAAKRCKIKMAVAAALLVICAPVFAYAAVNGDFFNRLWGKLVKDQIDSHDGVLYDEQDMPYKHTFPEREYVDIDPEKAEELIGKHVSYEPIVKKLGDTTLTILSSVYDGNAAVVEYTLERKGGVRAFAYSEITNEYRGAQFTQDTDFWFYFDACCENIYVDRKRSTEDILYCYDYMTLDSGAYHEEAKGLLLEVFEYPCTRGELFEADEETFEQYQQQTKNSRISVPLRSPAENKEFVNADGGKITVSPLSMKIDMHTGLGLAEDGFDDSNDIYYVSIHYKDGTDYVVNEHNLEAVHTCKVERNNSSCISCDTQGNLIIVFNRLVDPDTIASITVNKTAYSFVS